MLHPSHPAESVEAMVTGFYVERTHEPSLATQIQERFDGMSLQERLSFMTLHAVLYPEDLHAQQREARLTLLTHIIDGEIVLTTNLNEQFRRGTKATKAFGT
jgi:hypothetical protein